MTTIKIEGQEYPIVFKMKAVGIYQDLTGERLIGNSDELNQIFGGEIEEGDGKKKISIDANKFMALVQAVLMNGDKKLTKEQAEDIAGMVDFTDAGIYASLTQLFRRSDTEKNVPAPDQAGA